MPLTAKFIVINKIGSRTAWLFLYIAGFGLHILTLLRYPAPFVDEAWLSARAWEYIHTGKAFGILDAGVLDRFGGYWHFYPWLPTWIQSLGLRLAGAPTLVAIRSVSLVFGFLLLIPVYYIGKQVGDKTIGKLSSLSLLLVGAFFSSSHLGRMDVITAFLGYSAIALYLVFGARYRWIGLISGLLVGLAFETHPYGAIYGPVLLALIFLQQGWGFWRSCHFWSFGLGTSLGLLLYAGIHIFPAYETYLALNRIVYTTSHTPPLLTFNLGVIGESFVDTFISYLAYDPLLILLVMVALVDLFRKSPRETKVLPVILLALTAGNILLARNKLGYYTIHYSPAGNLYLFYLIVQFFRRPLAWRVDVVLRPILVILLLGINIFYNSWTRKVNTWLTYDPVKAFEYDEQILSQAIRPGDILFGPQTYWFGLTEHPFYSWQDIIYYRQWTSNPSLEAAINYIHPDILIIDSYLRGFISDKPLASNYFEFLRIPETEMNRFLQQHAGLLLDYQDPFSGHMQVYRLHWESSP